MDLAREKGVKRFVLLSASPIARGDEATGLGRVGTYLEGLEGIEWAVLKPTWFMGMFPFLYMASLSLISMPHLTCFHFSYL